MSLEKAYNKLVNIIEHKWKLHQSITDQKEFALAVKDYPYYGVLFQLKSGKSDSVRSYFQKVNVNLVVSLLKELKLTTIYES